MNEAVQFTNHFSISAALRKAFCIINLLDLRDEVLLVCTNLSVPVWTCVWNIQHRWNYQLKIHSAGNMSWWSPILMLRFEVSPVVLLLQHGCFISEWIAIFVCITIWHMIVLALLEIMIFIGYYLQWLLIFYPCWRWESTLWTVLDYFHIFSYILRLISYILNDLIYCSRNL